MDGLYLTCGNLQVWIRTPLPQCAYLVVTGDQAHTQLKWCAERGANRHISGDLSDFVPGMLRSIDLTITVAKAGITMTATGVA
jgi:hypothetical protein